METNTTLTFKQRWNLSFCFLAWACAICNVTLVVGTSNVVLLSIDEAATELSSLPLGAFFFGSAIVTSFSNFLFETQGRQFGFLVACALGLVGTILGGTSLMEKLPSVNILAAFFFGAANGISFSLRFAAIELVPDFFAARAVTLVVAGGVLAAFAGPESAHNTRGVFGDDNIEYLGVYLMTGIFSILNAIFVSMVEFPQLPATTTIVIGENRFTRTITEYWGLLKSRAFVVPMIIASLSWAIMAMPMSVVRVAMRDLGYSSRDSLLVIELHFVGMFATGFITGYLIQRLQTQVVCGLGVFVSFIALVFALTSKENRIWTWFLALILLGIGWNFSFTSATVWLSQTVFPYSKSQVQAANDFFMFLIAGCWIVSASYIYDSRTDPVVGWRTLNGVVIGLGWVFCAILALDGYLDRDSVSAEQDNKAVPAAQPAGDEVVVREVKDILDRDRGVDFPRTGRSAQTHSTTSSGSHNLSQFAPRSIGSGSGVEVTRTARSDLTLESKDYVSSIAPQTSPDAEPQDKNAFVSSFFPAFPFRNSRKGGTKSYFASETPRTASGGGVEIANNNQSTFQLATRSFVSQASGENNEGVEVGYGNEDWPSDEAVNANT